MDEKHKTDGTPCWCNPEVIHVAPYSESGLLTQMSLSELIKACGDKFDSLDRFPDGHFTAYTQRDEFSVADPNKGETPEEAVADLLLALNAVSDERSEESSALHPQPIK